MLMLVCIVVVLLVHQLPLVLAGPICTSWCLDCREHQGSSFCIQCINSSYVTDYVTHQCNVRPSYVPCSVPHCEVCTLNGPTYCYMCADGYQQKSEDLQCYLLPTTTTTSTTTTTPEPTTTTTTSTLDPPAPTTSTTSTTSTTTTSTTSTTSTTTTTTTTALCSVRWCSKCDYDDSSVCAQCYDGFVWKKSNKCEPINSCYVDGCLSCDPMDSSVCVVCRKGYSLVSSGSCQKDATSAAHAPPASSRSVAALTVVLSLLLFLS
jgi:hypothetical protein